MGLGLERILMVRKNIKDMTVDKFDDMLQKLMEERQERKRKKQSDIEM